MTNGPHKHTCSICHAPFYCTILMECFIVEAYAVCFKPECVVEWEEPKPEVDDEA